MPAVCDGDIHPVPSVLVAVVGGGQGQLVTMETIIEW